MRAYAFAIITSFAFISPAASAAQNPEVGRAELITKDVTGTIETAERKLKTGDKIHQNEVIATAQDSEAEI
ncbi:MAG TPA: hypothetical protein ENH05_00825, partial [Rhizobiales bacterium]|nr:hypothetical protein [Hyphomicrobiales bacterium]